MNEHTVSRGEAGPFFATITPRPESISRKRKGRVRAAIMVTAILGSIGITVSPAHADMEDLQSPRSLHQSVGYLRTDEGTGYCSATLVSENVVATAAHCYEGDVTDMWFYPAHDEASDPYGGWQGEKAVYSKDPGADDRDYAFIRLRNNEDDQAPGDVIEPTLPVFNLNEETFDGEVEVLGYTGDEFEGTTSDMDLEGCSISDAVVVRNADGDEVENEEYGAVRDEDTNCTDINDGASGGAWITQVSDGSWRLIGVHSGTGSDFKVGTLLGEGAQDAFEEASE
ncbi:trypsin-like serine peptidase [Streptomyces sp. NPDC091376]|uniref:trypsin-like serine peptidase n=1 Tax=Streptomyces sp. NPDC091376 TaxID=3365994 RepID=UPI0037F33495